MSEVKLTATELKVAMEYDVDAQSLVATIKLKAKVDTTEVSVLADLQSYPNVDLIAEKRPVKNEIWGN